MAMKAARDWARTKCVRVAGWLGVPGCASTAAASARGPRTRLCACPEGGPLDETRHRAARARHTLQGRTRMRSQHVHALTARAHAPQAGHPSAGDHHRAARARHTLQGRTCMRSQHALVRAPTRTAGGASASQRSSSRSPRTPRTSRPPRTSACASSCCPWARTCGCQVRAFACSFYEGPPVMVYETWFIPRVGCLHATML